MIEINNLVKKYRNKVVIDHVDISLDNKIYGFLGPNGSGKTTLLRLIARIIPADDGTIQYDQKEAKVGYLPQKYGVLKELTVYEQMEYYAIMKNIPKDERKEKILEVLESVNLTDANQKCSSLSGGMVRRLGIAQAYLGEPHLILLDEPSTGLDLEERLRFKTILSNSKKNCPILVSTHIVEDVESSCDLIYILHKGQIIYSGTPSQIAEEAEGFVYELSENEYNQFHGKHFVLKITEENEKKKYRILTSEMVEFQSVTPVLEDGYMALIKGMK